MDPWVVWLVVAGVLAVAEVFTLTLVLGLVAGGAAAAAAAALLGLGVPLQIAVFTAGSVGLVAAVRPVVASHRRALPAGSRTGVAALVGEQAVVLGRVDAHGGTIKLAGEVWSARPYDHTLVIEPGRVVDVLSIRGATAFVHPVDAPLQP